MDIIKYIILGIIQGITEPLPISSSGHLYIFKSLFNADIFSDLNFEIFVNFASFIAIFIIFFEDIKKLLAGFFSYIKSRGKKCKDEFKYCMMIIIGTIPVGIAGILFKDSLEELLASKTSIIGLSFVITGILLLLVINSNGKKKDNDITVRDALIIGFIQAIALIPGISRSGATLVGCLLCKLSKDTSLKYSFMLYFPVSIASMILGVNDVLDTGIPTNLLMCYILGMIFSGIFTFISYKWLTNIVRNGKLWTFSIYLFIIGIFTFIYFL